MSAETTSWNTGACPGLGQAAGDRLAHRGQLDDLDLAAAAAHAARRSLAAAGASRRPRRRCARPGPFPARAARSTPRSRAMRRASGVALTRRRRPSGGGALVADRRGGLRCGAWRRRVVRRPPAAACSLPVCLRFRPRVRRRVRPGSASPARPRRASRAPRPQTLLALGADHGDRRADVDLALGHEDLEQHAVRLGLDLLRHLVGVELVQRLALLDRVALGLEPADDRARTPCPGPDAGA